MKYIDAEKLLSEINARIERCEKDEEDGYPDTTSSEATLKSVRTFITSLQQEQPSLPFNLDEAAEKYSENILANNEDLQDAIEDAFKAGAQWRDAQVLKLPDSLDEAADKFAVSYDQGTCDGIAQDCFKAGAEWMAGQGESIVAKIGLATEEICCTISEETLDSLGVQADDEIILQIRKKQ